MRTRTFSVLHNELVCKQILNLGFNGVGKDGRRSINVVAATGLQSLLNMDEDTYLIASFEYG